MTSTRWLSTIAVGTTLVVAACADATDEAETTTTSTQQRAGSAEAFCDGWAAALGEGDDDAMLDVLDLAPAEIREDAALVREDERSRLAGRPSGGVATEAAAERLLAWVAVECDPEAGTSSTATALRVATPVDATGNRYTVCSPPTIPAQQDGARLVVYGDPAFTDPASSRAYAVLTGAQRELSGDGEGASVVVRGVAGSAAPFTVFQQVVLPDLGTVVAWEEDGTNVGLFGRGIGLDRREELVQLADELVLRDGRLELPTDARPDGVALLYDGPATVWDLVVPVDPAYQVTYRSARTEEMSSTITVTGTIESDAAFAASRFLSSPLERRAVAGRNAWVGNAWTESGPAVVAWREPAGVTVRFVGLGVDLADVIELAEQARPLDRDEWSAVVTSTAGCAVRTVADE